MSRLAELGKAARLARVGDRVDFVVTLGSDAHESSGRLERQTRGGTVAIREYRDARCEQVAEALALTLDLALEPDAPSRAGGPASARSASVAAPDGRGQRAVPAEAPAPLGDSRASTAASRGKAPAAPAGIAAGAQGTLATGVSPGVMPGVSVFVEEHVGADGLSSWRGTLLGAYRESTAQQREIDVLLVGGRVEGCPLETRLASLSFRPCLGLEAGVLRATGPGALGIADVGFWSAVVAHGRVEARLGDRLSLEAQLGAELPLVRYEMGTEDGSAAWFRTPSVGLGAALGAAWRIP